MPAISPPRAGLNPACYGRIPIGGSGVISRANSSMDAREILRFIADRVDYDNPTGSAVLTAPAIAEVCFGRPGCALNRPTWSPIKGSSASVSTIRSAIVVRQRFFGIFWPLFWPAPSDTDIISAQHFWTGGLEMAGPG